MTGGREHVIKLLREWLREWDRFLADDEDEEGYTLEQPETHAFHLDALEKVINVAEVANDLFTPKVGEFRSMTLSQINRIHHLRDLVEEMRRA